MTAVAVIGPGRVGTALALALPRPAYEVVAVAGRAGATGSASLERFTSLVPQARVAPSPAAAARAAELVLVCVPDDVLAAVIQEAVDAGGVVPGTRWVHTAGHVGLTPLRPAAAAGAAVAACHPAQTFPDPEAGAAALPGATWAVTAGEQDLGWARGLVTDLRGSPVTLGDDARPLYHAGLSVGSNATSAVVALARQLLTGAGVDEPGPFLLPLATTSAANAAQRGAAALTGPVRRGDAGTVAEHLAAIQQHLPEVAQSYLALARLALEQARAAGLDPAAATALDELLGGQGAAGIDAHGQAGPRRWQD